MWNIYWTGVGVYWLCLIKIFIQTGIYKNSTISDLFIIAVAALIWPITLTIDLIHAIWQAICKDSRKVRG
jgi:hypothetical protein